VTGPRRGARWCQLDGPAVGGLLGVALILWQTLARPGPWLDEIALLRNAFELDLRTLLAGHQDFDQLAPVGFVLAVRWVGAVLGAGDFAVRCVPALAALAGLAGAVALARRLHGGLVAGFVAPLGLAAAPLALRYASELRPYGSELALTLLATLVVAEGGAGRRRSALWLGLCAAGPWLAPAAAPALAGALVLTLAERGPAAMSWRTRASAAVLLIGGMAGSWGLIAAGRTPAAVEYLATYWQRGFPPAQPGLAPLAWLPSALAAVSGELFGLGAVAGAGIATLSGLGLLRLVRRERRTGVAFVVPVLAAAVLALVHAYPLAGRLALPLLAPLVFGLAELLAALEQRLGRGLPGAARAVPLALVATGLAVVAVAPPLGTFEPARPLIEQLAAQRRPGDPVYVYYGAWQAYCHYGRAAGLLDDRARIGGCHRGEPAAYERELDTFRGEPRVWILFTHDAPWRSEREGVLAHADRIGRRRLSVEIPRRGNPAFAAAALYLFDFSAAPTPGPFDPPEWSGGGRGCRAGPHVPPAPMLDAAAACRIDAAS
jgi:hypothetical protein